MALPAFGATAVSNAVPSQVVDALKSLKTASADQRQAVYDLISKEGDPRLAPALTSYRDGTLMLHGNQLAIYGPRVDVPGKGSMLPLLDAVTQQPIDGPDGQPILLPRIDLSEAMRAPPYREKRKIGDLLSSLALNDPNTWSASISIIIFPARTIGISSPQSPLHSSSRDWPVTSAKHW